MRISFRHPSSVDLRDHRPVRVSHLAGHPHRVFAGGEHHTRISNATRVDMEPAAAAPNEFERRMANWRRVVRDRRGESRDTGCCATWARWYVALRLSEPAPEKEQLEERTKPVRPLVAADHLDGWIVEAAWRMLPDFNDRQALKFTHLKQWPADKIRRQLVGVRGPHVRLVIARAENNLRAILKRLDDAATIRSTTCPPGCPVPTVESTLP